jgi:hypothetical protein
MQKIAVALLFALASQAAWARPFRTLPRLPLTQVKARAAAASAAERVLALDASAPALEPAAHPPDATLAATTAVAATATALPTTTPNPALVDASHVIVLPPPAPTRPGEGPLVIEVEPAYGEPAGTDEHALPAEAWGPVTGIALAETIQAAPAASVIAAPPSTVELTPVREIRQPDGRTLQLVRGRSGALIEILRDAQGRLLSARDSRE